MFTCQLTTTNATDESVALMFIQYFGLLDCGHGTPCPYSALGPLALGPWPSLLLQQLCPVFLTVLHSFLIPVGGLHLTDVSLAKEEQTHSRLTDAAADGVGKLAC